MDQKENKLIQSPPTARTALPVLMVMFTKTSFASTPVPALRNSNTLILKHSKASRLQSKASWDSVRTTLSWCQHNPTLQDPCSSTLWLMPTKSQETNFPSISSQPWKEVRTLTSGHLRLIAWRGDEQRLFLVNFLLRHWFRWQDNQRIHFQRWLPLHNFRQRLLSPVRPWRIFRDHCC